MKIIQEQKYYMTKMLFPMIVHKSYGIENWKETKKVD